MALTKYKNWSQTDEGNVVEGATITVMRVADSSFADLFEDSAGTTPKLNPFTMGTDDKFFEFWIEPDRYQITVASDDGGATVPLDIVDARENLTYDLRSELVAWVAGGGFSPDGAVIPSGGVEYVASLGATAIPDLLGWLPFGLVTPEHYGATGDGAADDRPSFVVADAAGGSLHLSPATAYNLSTPLAMASAFITFDDSKTWEALTDSGNLSWSLGTAGENPKTDAWDGGKTPALLTRSRPKFLTPEMYLGLETQIIYAPAQGDPGDYTGATDFAQAFTDMRAEIDSLLMTSQWPNYGYAPAGISFNSGLRYLTTGPLPLDDLYTSGFLVSGNGASIVARFNGGSVVDAGGAQFIQIKDLRIESDSDLIPGIGVLFARPGSGTAERNWLQNVNIQGWFSETGLYNYASEVFEADHLTVYNYALGGGCVHVDGTNEIDVNTFTAATITNAVGESRSTNEILFTSLDARSVQGTEDGTVRITSGPITGDGSVIVRNVKFTNSYAVNSAPASNTDDRPAFLVKGDINGLDIDCHIEPFSGTDRIYVSHNVLFDTTTADCNINRFHLYDHWSDAQKSIIDTTSVSNALTIVGADIEISYGRGQDTLGADATIVGPNMTNASIIGTFKVPAKTALNNFSSLGDFKGTIESAHVRGGVSVPAIMSGTIITSDKGSSRELRSFDHTTPDAATVAVGGADVIRVTGGTVATIAGFSDTSQVRQFMIVNGRGVSITIQGLAGANVVLPTLQTLRITQAFGGFYSEM